MPISIPTKPSVRQIRQSISERLISRPEYHGELTHRGITIPYPFYLALACLKIGFLILGAIVIGVGMIVILVLLIKATWPMSLLSLALIAVMTWLAIRS